jgi:hypothetical protein
MFVPIIPFMRRILICTGKLWTELGESPVIVGLTDQLFSH